MYLMRSDGSNRHTFAPTVGGTMASGVWSPNGATVAYVGGLSGVQHVLRTIRADGAKSSIRVIASGIRVAEDPDWSPDSKRLVFVRAPETVNKRVIYRVNADATGLKKLVDYGADKGAGEPVWSPNGAQIAFDKANYLSGAHNELWTMNANGADRTRVDRNG